MITSLRPYRGLAATIVLFLVAFCAFAQGYPAKPIRIVVPFVAGGSMDRLARIFQTHMLESWSQPIVVDNRPGGGTVIGTELVFNAPPDGHTLLMIANSAAINVTLRPKLPYDLLKDFVPISLVARTPHLLVVPASLNVNRLEELVALAQAQPGRLNYASIGPGSVQHLSGEMFKTLAGIDIVHVPYAGTAPAVIAMLAGEVSMMFANAADVQQHVKAGRIRALAVASDWRQSGLEDIPTFAESGFSGFESSTWYGVIAPNGTPPATVSRLNAEVLRILHLPKVRETLEGEGMQTLGTTPDSFRTFLAGEVDKYGRVVRAAKLKVD
ncbi:tripartite tricarboxylate transporter substrate binding protein [Variovorax paradoxus]|nr:tripartite tricarboxylate transporter substrate binding protein [Variovorax paradoxus]